MNIQDIIVTPIYIILILVSAYFVSIKFVCQDDKKYFMWGLIAKISGCLFFSFIYQLYYEGGDTTNYWTNGGHLKEVLLEEPLMGIELFFGNYQPQALEYYQHIWLRKSESAMMVVRTSALFDIITFSTYSATSIFFALISFIGTWEFFKTIYKTLPIPKIFLFTSIFLIPGVFFWGAGLMKEGLVMPAMFIAFSMVLRWFILKERKWWIIVIFLFSCWILFAIKIYILISVIPIFFILFLLKWIKNFKHIIIQLLVFPTALFFIGLAGYLIANFISLTSSGRYSLEAIPRHIRLTAYDLAYGWGRDAGSSYNLGELDGTWSSVLPKLIPAVVVTLFRPFPWEINSLMVMFSSIESTGFLFFLLFILFFHRSGLKIVLQNPILLSFLLFSILFAFAVGISTYNFGSLSRYKIPALPFFSIFLISWFYSSKYLKASRQHNKEY